MSSSTHYYGPSLCGIHDQTNYSLFVNPQIMNDAQIAMFMCFYGYILFAASGLISDGSELLLLVPRLAPIVGSIVLPVLGAVPDGMMVLFSGLGANPQEEVAVGVGTLAGSTVMLLTLPWSIAIFSGRVDLDETGKLNYKRPTNAGEHWDKLTPGNVGLKSCGVGYTSEIQYNAKFMMATLAGYLVIALPSCFFTAKLFYHKSESRKQIKFEANKEKIFVYAALAVCIAEFVYYLYKEWKNSEAADSPVGEMITETNVQAIQGGQVTLRSVMAKFRESTKGTNVNEASNNPDTLDEVRRFCKVLAPFFAMYDINGDNQIDLDEFFMIVKDLGGNLSKETQVKMFRAADIDKSQYISFEEFVACLMSYTFDESNDLSADRRKHILEPSTYMSPNEDADEEEDIPEDLADLEPEEQQRQIKKRACLWMGFGTLLILLFSDPTVDLMNETGIRLKISPFYVAFVLAPIASNAAELVAAYNYAQKRTVKSMTTSLSTLEGAGVMNNTYTFGTLLFIMCLKGVYWDFTAEVISMVFVEVLIGLPMLMKEKKVLTLFDGVMAASYYVLALLLVAFLNYCVHLD